MLSNIFQELTIFFRNAYISSLESFVVKVDPKEVQKETYLKLSEQFRKQLDLHTKIYDNRLEDLHKQKKDWSEMVDGTFAGPVKERIREVEKLIKETGQYTKLHLISFNRNLTSDDAKKELRRLGFQSVNFLETILFVQRYEKSIPKLPVISLDAYGDMDMQIKIRTNNFYSVCFHGNRNTLNESGFADVGGIEDREFFGHEFMAGVSFLAKPI